jgi:chromate transport protein ChrA
VPLTILPAALAFIVAAALRLGRNITVPSIEALLAATAFVGAFVFRLSPALLLLAGGFAGVFVLSDTKRRETTA